jgi:peptidoglycan lytic transglycosylase
MTRTAKATLAAALCLSAGAVLPAGAAANSGGTVAPEPGIAPVLSSTGATAPAGPGAGALRAGPAALLGRRQLVSGRLAGASSWTAVLVQRSDPRAGWVTVATGRTRAGGIFSAAWRTDRVGRLTLRAVPTARAAAAAGGFAAPTARTTVYRASIATHYGRGWYGTRTACGTILTPRTVGVAHKTLPCGTVLEFYYRGRTVRAPVVDRGPYANHAAWDLTMPASRALGFNGKDYVGAIAVGRVSLRRGR